MKVLEYIDYLTTGDCAKLAISNVGDLSLNPVIAPTVVQVANQAKFINYINLANLALHKRYHLLKKTIELDRPADGEEYPLPSDFLVPVEAYYQSDFCPVTIRDDYVKVVDGIDTAVSILRPEPFKVIIKGTDQEIPVRTLILLKYAAAPRKATTPSVDLKISEVYTESLLNYAAFKAHSTISGDIKDENNTYYLRYEAACRQLVTSGMGPNNEIDTNTKLTDNGFV
jgi:hypothetical protein